MSGSLDLSLDGYPTLQRAAASKALIRIAIGPAGCLPPETEVMTRQGWVALRDFGGRTEALVYDPKTYRARFDCVEYVKLPDTGFWRFRNHHTIDMEVSDEHKIYYQTYYSQQRHGKQAPWQCVSGRDAGEHIAAGRALEARIPTVFGYDSDTRYPATDAELRVSVALAADGSLPKHGREAIVTLRKARKKRRLEQLLADAGIDYEVRVSEKRPNEYRYRFIPPEWTKDLTRFYCASEQQLQVIAEELLLWDGTRTVKSAAYVSTDKAQVEFAQFAFTVSGHRSGINAYKDKVRTHHSEVYRATYEVKQKNTWGSLRTAQVERTSSSDGYKYCLTTSTGMFVARHNGRIFCTGNSSKTTWCLKEMVTRAILQEPNAEGVRHTRWLVARQTYDQLRKSTLPSIAASLGAFYRVTETPTPRARASFPLPDGTRVESEMVFLGMDRPDALSNLLGLELTGAFLDEVSELSVKVVEGALKRAGRFPSNNFGQCSWSGVIGATNGPKKSHWLYDWSLGPKPEWLTIEEQTGRPYFELFQQPPALLRPQRPGERWEPNPAAENVQNLQEGYGYYFKMLGSPDDEIKAYVEGEFSDIKTGKTVWPEFSYELHRINSDNILIPPGAPLYLSFDFGRTPVALIAIVTELGRLVVVDEVVGDNMAIATLYEEKLRPILRTRHKDNKVDAAWGDPAGADGGQQLDLSPFDILHAKGIPIAVNWNTRNDLEPRLEAVRRRLRTLGRDGKPLLQISDRCPKLLAAVAEDYVYESVTGHADVYRDVPTKSHVNWVSDLADALQYLCLGFDSRYTTAQRGHDKRVKAGKQRGHLIGRQRSLA